MARGSRLLRCLNLFLLITGLIIIILTVIALRLSQQSAQISSPSPSGNISTYQNFFSPTPSPSTATSSSQAYSGSNLEKDFQRLSNLQPLPGADAKIRADLIASLGNKSGTINSTSDYQIDYDSTPDQFMVEIKINDAQKAKKEAEDYLSQKGLSTQGICNLPVVIYLEFSVKQYYKANNLQFNPIPDGC